MSSPTIPDPNDGLATGTSRRRFLTYLVAAPTLAVAVNYGLLDGVASALPGSPEAADFLDLGDILILSGRAFEDQLILLVAEEDGSVSCALPREECGQGITTSVAMLIADELSLPLAKVRITLAEARPELRTAQLTGGSNTIRSVYQPIKTAAATFRARMGAAASQELGVPVERLRVQGGSVMAPDGRSLTFGQLAVAATSSSLVAPADVPVVTPQKLVGTPQNRVDARKMVTGQFKYTNDLEPVPGLLRSMVRRPPTIRGSVKSIDNLAAVKRMPGVVDVFEIELSRIASEVDGEAVETGVAVVARTFGQALDAKEALRVTWNGGPLAQEDDDSVQAKLKAINPPVVGTPGATVVDGEFEFHFASHAPLESNTAIADVRGDKATIWAGLKTPVVAGQTIADEIGIPQDNVRVIVVQGGGSFGRRLFFDAALEAARISQKAGKPVKHMWTRIDDMRHGRARAATHQRVRFAHRGDEVLSFEHHVASVETDFRHGLGEILTAMGSQNNPPSALVPVSSGGNASFAQSVFFTTVKSPYAFGRTDQLLNELSLPFNTGSFRSVYSANTRGAEEIMIDELARSMGEDPAELRLRLVDGDRQKAVIKKAMDLGKWGRRMPRGFAQGIAFHEEYRSMTACLVEIDARDPKDPRVTKATITADYGLPVNPRGLEAQLLGGLVDAIGTTLRTGLHLKDGLFLEGSYSQFHYPRQRDTPTDVKIFIFPKNSETPGGAGELGVPAAVGAVANAYARATGTKPRSFPIVFPVDFTPFPKGTGSTRQPTNLPPKR